MSVERVDVVIVGGGMAGVSLGYEIAGQRSVVLLEQEPGLALHTTGRSAAVFVESLGALSIRALTQASKSFLLDPDPVFEESPLRPLPILTVAGPGRAAALREYHAEIVHQVVDAILIGPERAVELNPMLAADRVELAMYEPSAMEIDVHAIHQVYAREFRARGGVIRTRARVDSARRVDGTWNIELEGGEHVEAPVVVDAAGAWAGVLANAFGACDIGIHPLRRTLFGVAAPAGFDPSGLPLTADFDSAYYFKPEGGQILCSPAEETPDVPGDARPDQLEIARAIDDINEATTLGVRSVRSQWAGLRSFAADREPVVGWDPVAEGFFWFAGQGGYGIQTAPALARVGAALLTGEDPPADVVAAGLRVEDISPARAGIAGARPIAPML